jgi:glycosyltransferase involved in cell wall biosynthesis
MKEILFISSYPVTYPPKSGGPIRSFHLSKHLGKIHAVTLVSYGDKDEDKKVGNVHFIQFAKTKLDRIVNTFVDPLFSFYIFVQGAKYLRKTIKQKIKNADIVVMEFPYQAFLLKRAKGLKIYDAHNVEYDLFQYILPKSFKSKIALWYVYFIEKKACHISDIVITCSREDRERIILLYNLPEDKVFVVPNGVDIEASSISKEEEKNRAKKVLHIEKPTVLFIGSRHSPNLQAVLFIESIAGHLKDFIFIVAGSVAGQFLEIKNIFKESMIQKTYLSNEDLLYGYGWHPKEHWGGLEIRWTNKEFIIDAPSNAKECRINFLSPFKNIVEIYIGQTYYGMLSVQKKWETLSISLPKQGSRLKFIFKKTKKRGNQLLGVAIKDIIFTLEGSAKKTYSSHECKNYPIIKENILFLDDLGDYDKKVVFKASDMAINPVTAGSGTNLKMFEYMANGIPVITTEVGKRGIAGKEKEYFLVSAQNEIPNTIKFLYSNKSIYSTLKDNARNYVEREYSWDLIGERFLEIINKEHARHA